MGSNNGNRHWTASSRHATDTGFLNIKNYELPKIHTHKIYHYPQQQSFAYRVTESVSAAAGNDSASSRSSQAIFCFKIHTLY